MRNILDEIIIMIKLTKDPKVEIEPFDVSDNEYQRDGKHWTFSTLKNASKGLKPYDLQLSALDLNVSFAYSKTVYYFLFQLKRVMDANLDYPIIQAPDGEIIDGWHRIVRAIWDGKTTIKAVRLPVMPEPNRVDEADT